MSIISKQSMSNWLELSTQDIKDLSSCTHTFVKDYSCDTVAHSDSTYLNVLRICYLQFAYVGDYIVNVSGPICLWWTINPDCRWHHWPALHSFLLPCWPSCSLAQLFSKHNSTDTRKFDRGLTQLMHDNVHWLDMPECVKYKAIILTRRCLIATAPWYLAANCVPVSEMAQRRHLRSAAGHQLVVP